MISIYLAVDKMLEDSSNDENSSEVFKKVEKSNKSINSYPQDQETNTNHFLNQIAYEKLAIEA